MIKSKVNGLIEEIISTIPKMQQEKPHVFDTTRVPDTNKPFYFGKIVNRINHLSSETYYTKEYIQRITSLLGDPAEFSSLTDSDKKIRQSDLDYLSHEDYRLKRYLHKSVYDSKGLHQLFPESYSSFLKQWNKLLVGSETQRGYMRSIPYKYKRFYDKIIDLLIKKEYNVGYLSNITEAEIDEVLKKYLTPEVVYDAICVILIRAARDSLFEDTETQYNEVSLSIIQHEVKYEVYYHMMLISMTHAITYRIGKTRKVVLLDQLLKSVRNFLIHDRGMLLSIKECQLFIDGSQSLFQAFTRSGFFIKSTSKIVRVNGTPEAHIRHYFPLAISVNLSKYTTTPRIIAPDTVKSHDLISYMIPIDYAKVTIVPSNSFLESLNISNGKCFSINENFCNILTGLYTIDECDINHPITSKAKLNQMGMNVRVYGVCKLNKFRAYIVDRIYTELTKKNSYLKHPHQFRYVANQTKIEAIALAERRKYSDLRTNLSVQRKGGITRHVLASILQGFPLYFTNKVCGTTRVFASEHVLSRHIGCLKLLRGEEHKIPVTDAGIAYMLEAYYSNDACLLQQLHECLSKPYSKRDLELFYKSNKIDYSEKEAVSHFMLLAVELNQIFEANESKTKLLLQYDQVASGLVFISILWKNVELGKRTNVISGGYEVGPYEFAMYEFEKFYEEHVEKKNDKVLEFFKSNKKVHKYALMCYAYNQKAKGRSEAFTKSWQTLYNTKPTSGEWAALFEVATKYTDFIDTLFPGVNTQFSIIDEIIKLVVTNAGFIKIRTLDGAVINWKFYQQKRSSRNSFNASTMAPESYALYEGVNDISGKPAVDIEKSVNNFRSYLIHSVDAGVMRLIINNMYHNHGYRIDQLHDCILMHPNYVDVFYKEVEDIYKCDAFQDYMNTHVFCELKSIISSDKFEQFDELVNRFNKNSDYSYVVTGNFRKVYTPEV